MATGSTACATKGYVKEPGRRGYRPRSRRSASLLEETQERTRKNEAPIADVDQERDGRHQGAQDAAQTADGRPLGRHEGGARRRRRPAAAEKADAVDKASKRLVYTVVLSEDEGQLQVRRGESA